MVGRLILNKQPLSLFCLLIIFVVFVSFKSSGGCGMGFLTTSRNCMDHDRLQNNKFKNERTKFYIGSRIVDIPISHYDAVESFHLY